jgi:hypothetical protein
MRREKVQRKDDVMMRIGFYIFFSSSFYNKDRIEHFLPFFCFDFKSAMSGNLMRICC